MGCGTSRTQALSPSKVEEVKAPLALAQHSREIEQHKEERKAPRSTRMQLTFIVPQRHARQNNEIEIQNNARCQYCGINLEQLSRAAVIFELKLIARWPYNRMRNNHEHSADV